MPDLRQIGLDPAVQGVPVKKKLSVTGKRFEVQKHFFPKRRNCELIAKARVRALRPASLHILAIARILWRGILKGQSQLIYVSKIWD